MARPESEKNFGADIPKELFNRIEEYIDSHYNLKKKQLVIATTELFLSLPEDLQALVLNASPKSKAFVKVIQKIVDNQLKTLGVSFVKAPKPNLQFKKSIDSIQYFIKFKLPSPEERELLNKLRESLSKEIPTQKKKRKSRA